MKKIKTAEELETPFIFSSRDKAIINFVLEKAAKIEEDFWYGRICSCGNCNAGAYLADKIRSLINTIS